MSGEILSTFYQIVGHLSNGDTEDETLAQTVEFATVFLNCDECCTYVRQAGELVPWVWKHVRHGSLERTALPVDSGFAAAAAEHHAPIAVWVDPVKGPVFKIFQDWSANPGETFVCVPFISRAQLLGAITFRHWRPRPYNQYEYKLLSNIGYIVGADLGIARLEQENSHLVLELETRKLVERSKGILQRDLGLSEEEAFLALQRQSEEKKRPMKEIAQAIILSSEIKESVVQTE